MFQPGIRGNTHGRPRGSISGRAQTLASLDRMLSNECNQQVLFDALEKDFQSDPVRFFRKTVVPLIPRSMREAPPPDANDDWLPLDRHPSSKPPSSPGPYIPPPPEKESSSGIPDLPPAPSPSPSPLASAHCPLPIAPVSQLLTPHSSLRSFACYLLLLIPFALKTDGTPHLAQTLVHAASDRLSRIVHNAGVAVRGLAVRDTRLPQPARKEPCRLRMNGGGPVLLSPALPLGGRANPLSPCYSLLLIPHSSCYSCLRGEYPNRAPQKIPLRPEKIGLPARVCLGDYKQIVKLDSAGLRPDGIFAHMRGGKENPSEKVGEPSREGSRLVARRAQGLTTRGRICEVEVWGVYPIPFADEPS